MGTKFVVGNLLDDATVTMTPAADPLFPVEFLRDGPGQMGARFGALDADPEVVIDLSSGGVPNGDGDVVGASPGAVIASSDPSVLAIETPSDWELVPSGESTPSKIQMLDDAGIGSLPNDHGGNDRCLGMTAGTGGSVIGRVLFTVPAGSTRFVHGWCANGVSASAGASIRLYNRTTGLYLGTDGAWHAAAQDLVADLTTNHVWLGVAAGAGKTFTVPTSEEMGGSENAVLEYRLIARDSSGYTFFDDLQLDAVQPADFMMVAGGHSIPSGLAPVWQSSDDATSWTTRATFTVRSHQFYALLAAPVTARYHRLKMTGTPTAKVWVSDLVLGLSQTLDREPQEPIEKEYVEIGQQRLQSPAGSRRIANRGPYPPRRYTLRFRFATAAEEAAVMEILIARVRGGERSVVVIPASDLGVGAAVYGDLQAGAVVTHSMAGAFQPDGESREYYSDATFIVEEGAGFTLE